MFQNLRVSLKLALAFGLLVILTLAMAAVGVTSLSALNRNVEDIGTQHAPGITFAGEWHAHMEGGAKHMNAFFVVAQEGRKAELDAVRAMRAERDRLIGELAKLSLNPAGEAALRTVQASNATYVALETEFLQLADAGKADEAKDLLLNRATRAQVEYIQGLDKLSDVMEDDTKDEVRDSAAIYHAGLNLLVGSGIVCALLGAAFGWIVSRSITAPIAQAVAVARRVAEGDLRVEVQTTRRDEPGQLLQAIGTMTANLRHLVGEVMNGAHLVADTSTQIAQGNVDLSQRTEEQASTLEETASSMEELTSSVTQNADHARQASQLAVDASQVARKGGEVVGQVVQTMTGISESSRKISEIIGVIDGIAFQTNILALNAAVEAARAGEQGRGFAVVAAEVRTLAQRSAAAAKEIKALIGGSVEQVDAGSRLVESAGRTMNDIVASVQKVSDLIGEIAAASHEQSSGIEQVNTAVTQMDQVVQQNASLVEEATGATESMKEQAAALLQTVSRFRMDVGAAPASRVPAAAVVAPAVARAAPAPTGAIPFKPAVPLAPQRAKAASSNGHAGNGEWSSF
ncbi:methyl-accepting chemotaxis protein [Ramlibacter alkalitolerans]|uniref:MCP four helix bundle domain-containing protein n=1 Tax=Ramlibacter alkalitolerans TaxID=2039631 RepID=A0ABS1JT83_9BURK|nr:MCP four helix bundle domain-containing protein [Ramlibacter alkalitolerans]